MYTLPCYILALHIVSSEDIHALGLFIFSLFFSIAPLQGLQLFFRVGESCKIMVSPWFQLAELQWVHKHALSRGVWGHGLQRKFCIFPSVRLSIFSHFFFSRQKGSSEQNEQYPRIVAVVSIRST